MLSLFPRSSPHEVRTFVATCSGSAQPCPLKLEAPLSESSSATESTKSGIDYDVEIDTLAASDSTGEKFFLETILRGILNDDKELESLMQSFLPQAIHLDVRLTLEVLYEVDNGIPSTLFKYFKSLCRFEFPAQSFHALSKVRMNTFIRQTDERFMDYVKRFMSVLSRVGDLLNKAFARCFAKGLAPASLKEELSAL
ncbi:hypothetical protein P9112_011847 [Eukaryota sp. TZLM1-RC]